MRRVQFHGGQHCNRTATGHRGFACGGPRFGPGGARRGRAWVPPHTEIPRCAYGAGFVAAAGGILFTGRRHATRALSVRESEQLKR